jgi:hypothetical protein
MTTFDPSFAALDRPDHLGGALQQGLPRPMNPKLTWGLIRTFLLAGISGGIVPTVFLARRLRDFAKAEQLQFWHLTEWLRLQTGDSQATAAGEAAQRVMPGMGLRGASLAFVAVAIGIACTALPHNGALVPRWFALTLPQLRLPEKTSSFEALGRHWQRDRRGDAPDFFEQDRRHDFDAARQWSHIYHPDETDPAGQRRWNDDQPDNPAENWRNPDDSAADGSVAAVPVPLISPDLSHAFALAMSGAALCWLIEINSHIARVRRFVGAFNQLSNRYGVGPVRAPGLHLGIRPLWLLGAAALCALGGFWAVPVMLAGAAHRRYIKSTSLRLRSDLARRQRDVLLAKRPTLHVPASTHLMGACPRENCRAPFPPEAAYCRRCGMKLEG